MRLFFVFAFLSPMQELEPAATPAMVGGALLAILTDHKQPNK